MTLWLGLGSGLDLMVRVSGWGMYDVNDKRVCVYKTCQTITQWKNRTLRD